MGEIDFGLRDFYAPPESIGKLYKVREHVTYYDLYSVGAHGSERLDADFFKSEFWLHISVEASMHITTVRRKKPQDC